MSKVSQVTLKILPKVNAKALYFLNSFSPSYLLTPFGEDSESHFMLTTTAKSIVKFCASHPKYKVCLWLPSQEGAFHLY